MPLRFAPRAPRARDLGLVVVETSSGSLLKTPPKGSVANIYLADWDTIDVPLQPLRDRGWEDEADRALADLSRLTAKRLTPKNPNIPSVDAVANWTELRTVLDVSRRYTRPGGERRRLAVGGRRPADDEPLAVDAAR